MAGRIEHMIAGAVVGLLTLSVLKKQRNEQMTTQETLGAAIFGSFAGIIPDIIEPATGPDHRRFTHSKMGGAIAIAIINKAIQNPEITQNAKDWIQVTGAAYGSHLFLDSQTPAGLPWY